MVKLIVVLQASGGNLVTNAQQHDSVRLCSPARVRPLPLGRSAIIVIMHLPVAGLDI